LTMITRYFRGEVPYPSHTASHTRAEDAIADTARKVIAECHTLFDEYQFSRALETAWGLVAAVDKYIVENEPWALGEKRDEASLSRLATVLYTSTEALRVVTALAHPVIPEATAKIWAQLGLGDIKKFQLSNLQWGQLKLGTKLAEVQPVFPRADKSTIDKIQQIEERGRSAAERAEGNTMAPLPPADESTARPAASAPDGKI